MPELPDIELYLARLRDVVQGQTLESLTIFNPFVLRSFAPKPADLAGATVEGISRLGKRIVLHLDGDRFIVIHLMIAGRLQWQTPLPPFKRANGKIQLAAFRFPSGQLTLVETSTKKRASIHLIQGQEGLQEHNRHGLDVLTATPEAFAARLKATNRTLKRALTDPRTFDGIGNAFSDEILFAARLSPVKTTQSLNDEATDRLRVAARDVLLEWTAKLQRECPKFPRPADVTATRPDYAVHDRFGLPCPVCGSPVQRIVFAENETNYCAKCQNEGRLLADRSLSRLLKDDWPKTLEEMVGS